MSEKKQEFPGTPEIAIKLVFEKYLSCIRRGPFHRVQNKAFEPIKTEFLQSEVKMGLVRWKKQNPVAFG